MTHTDTFSSPFNDPFTKRAVFTQNLDVLLLFRQLLLKRLNPPSGGLKLGFAASAFRILLHDSLPRVFTAVVWLSSLKRAPNIICYVACGFSHNNKV